MSPFDDPETGDVIERRSDAFFRARELRAALVVRLDREEEDELCRRLRTCGDEFMLNCTSCGHVHRCEQACHLKWCPVCARSRSAQRVAKYERAAARMKWPLHVTLTRCNVGEITRDHIRALKRDCVRLRRTKLFRECVVGGLVSLELTNTGRGWHPHLHLLIDCEWLSLTVRKPIRSDSRDRKAAKCKAASAELERTWSKIIGQLLSSVKVRRCSGAEAVREVLKYAVKPSDLIDSPDPVGPAIRAISEGRLSTPFGSLYGLRHELNEEKRPPFKCPSCAEVGTMIPEAIADRMLAAARDPMRKFRGPRRAS